MTSLHTLCCCVLLFTAGACAWRGEVHRVKDGDTYEVVTDMGLITVRLYGVDTPEWNQRYGKEATQFVKKRIYGKRIRGKTVDIDYYGRSVAIVWIGDSLLSATLVRAGCAWVYDRYCRQQPVCARLDSLQQFARQQKRGLWAQRDRVAPWDFRHSASSQTDEASNNESFGPRDTIDCSDFATQKQAQQFFKTHDPHNDPFNLDRNKDGNACEQLP